LRTRDKRLWLENFDHVKSLKLLGSSHIKYPTLASGYMPKATGRSGFARIL
jgi:hypothetical protein